MYCTHSMVFSDLNTWFPQNWLAFLVFPAMTSHVEAVKPWIFKLKTGFLTHKWFHLTTAWWFYRVLCVSVKNGSVMEMGSGWKDASYKG